jgi:hypothetical protein
MNAGKAVYGILSANSGVTDIVGTNIFPEIAEQETAVPFIVYQLQSVDPDDTHDGPSKLDEVRFEFLCYADSYNAAADLGVAVRAALDRVSGTYNGVHVESIQFNDVDVNIEYDPRRYSQVLTFTFRIKRDDVTIALGTPVTGAVLGDLSDVDVTGVTNGQLIAYNSTSGNWEAANDAGGAEQLNDLSDVIVSLPAEGEVLKYDGGEFVNDNLTKADVGLGNVDNTSDADKPVSSATQTALDAKADTSAVPTDLNDLSDVSIVGTPTGNQALIYDGTAGVFKSLPNFTNRFVDEVERGLQMPSVFFERGYSVKADGDGIFIDSQSDTPATGKVIERKIYHKAGFISEDDVIGDYTLIHTFADNTAYADTVAVFDAFENGATYGTPPFTLAQSWEEVDESTLLLDTYTGAAAAYSLRQLRTGETEAVRVRRSSDNTEQTIGFSNGQLDTTALATFCGSSNGFVKTWFDQSGNGNDATQTATGSQPKIYDGTTGVVTEGTKPAINLDSNDFLDLGSLSAASGDNVSYYWVGDWTGETSNNNRWILHADDTNSYQAPISTNGNANDGYAGLTNVTGYKDGVSVAVATRDNVHDAFTSVYHLGELYGTTTTSFSSTELGRYPIGNNFYLNGNIQEFILYTSDQSSNRTNIEDNINTFYSIY